MFHLGHQASGQNHFLLVKCEEWIQNSASMNQLLFYAGVCKKINYNKYLKKNKNILMYEYTAARRFSNYTSVNLGVVWTDKGLAPDYFGAQLLG